MKTTTYLAAALSGMYYTTHLPAANRGGRKANYKVILMADKTRNQTAFVAVEASNSTVICANCPPVSSTPDVVTRSAVPTTSCTGASLTAVYSSGASTTEPAMTTSTVYTSIVYTVTSCPPTVTNCPVGKKTTEMTSYTTVCPVSSSPVYESSAVYTSAGSVYTSVAVYTSAPGGETSMMTQHTGSASAVATSTGVVPVTAGASNLAVGMGGAAAVAVAALFML